MYFFTFRTQADFSASSISVGGLAAWMLIIFPSPLSMINTMLGPNLKGENALQHPGIGHVLQSLPNVSTL